jgi:DNA-binding transcriptional MerR regulator
MSQIPGLPDAQLTVGAVAQRLGVAPATLRTWGHRYGLGPSGHAAGKHRRYTPEDVARLDLLRKLMLNGVTVSEAARIVTQPDVDLSSVTSTPDSAAAPKRFHIVADGEVADTQEPIVNPTQNLSEENVVSLDSAKSQIRSLTRAAQMLDGLACERIIEKMLASNGVIWSWDNVIHPVLVAAGEHWEKTGEGVEVEHMLSEALTSQFKRVAGAVQEPVNARPVVLACAPHDMHSLPIYAIAAGLAEHGIASRVLGPRMPGEALAVACNRIGPSAVVVWSQTIGTADVEVWNSLSNQRPAPLKMSAGPGWSDELPDGVVGSRNFSSTLVELAAAAGQFNLSGQA